MAKKKEEGQEESVEKGSEEKEKVEDTPTQPSPLKGEGEGGGRKPTKADLKVYDPINDQATRTFLTDIAKNLGTTSANRLIQAVVRKDLRSLEIDVNGALDERTIFIINSLDPKEVFAALRRRAENIFKDLGDVHFVEDVLKGVGE